MLKKELHKINFYIYRVPRTLKLQCTWQKSQQCCFYCNRRLPQQKIGKYISFQNNLMNKRRGKCVMFSGGEKEREGHWRQWKWDGFICRMHNAHKSISKQCGNLMSFWIACKNDSDSLWLFLHNTLDMQFHDRSVKFNYLCFLEQEKRWKIMPCKTSTESNYSGSY